MKELKFKLLHEDAKLPVRKTEEAAGLDLYAIEDMTIQPMHVLGKGARAGKAVMSTGLQVELPVGYKGAILPRSGLAFIDDVVAVHGTIDSDFTGEIKVLLYNMGNNYVEIKKGDRIAQLVIWKVELPVPVEAKEITKKTARGTGGFGHTGK